MRKPYPTDLSDAEWNYLEPHLPIPTGHGRPRAQDLREILNAIFYPFKSGCQWRLLPHDFPRWPTILAENVQTGTLREEIPLLAPVNNDVHSFQGLFCG